ncbi:MAG TPA: hypothetical protein VEI01_19465 [Terriglobales bacterium]|nr:hypothetical protein [Terriglobales bacterium]
MDNYFKYFTEIEEHFQRRRGSLLLLSTLDWALIETWKDAGIPLEAVLRGIDTAFDRYDERPSKSRKVNSLAYCSQEVLATAEAMKEAAVGATREEGPRVRQFGLPPEEIVAFLRRNAVLLDGARLAGQEGALACPVATETAKRLRELADGLAARPNQRLEDLERRLTVLEEKLFAVLLASSPDAVLLEARAQADRELAPYRSKMSGLQIEQLQKQYLQKRLLEKHGLPRLSLFYM